MAQRQSVWQDLGVSVNTRPTYIPSSRMSKRQYQTENQYALDSNQFKGEINVKSIRESMTSMTHTDSSRQTVNKLMTANRFSSNRRSVRQSVSRMSGLSDLRSLRASSR